MTSTGATLLAILSIAVALHSSVTAQPTSSPGAAELEARGEAAWKKARPHYSKAYLTGLRVEKEAVKLGDEPAARRARDTRRRLGALLREPKLARETSGEQAPGDRREPVGPQGASGELGAYDAARRLAVARHPDVPRGALKKVEKFLGDAEKKFARVRDREERDVLLLLETAGLFSRLVGETYQLEADEAFRSAFDLLAKVEPGPSSVAARVRLAYKLRRYSEAREEERRGASMLARLSGKPLVNHLRVVQNIARLEGNQELVRALAKRMNAIGGVAEDQSLPLTPFSTFLLGSVSDLAVVAGTTLGVLARYPLAERERNLAAHLSAVSAMELGEYALAEEVLRSRPIRAEQDLWLRASLAGRLGLCRIQLGDYEGALHALEAGISAASALKGTGVFRARLHLNAARASLGLGAILEARTRALEVLGSPGVPSVLKVRARLFLASVLYEQARDNPRLVSDVWGAFRQAERRLDDIKDALKPEEITELRTALAINRANTHRLELIHLGSAATPAQEKKLRDAAIDLQDQALRDADKAGMFRMAAVAASNLGELYLERGDPDPAKQFVDWALARAQELRLFETEWRCHWYLARIAASEGRQAAADKAYEKALALVESYRSRILDLERKSGFLNDKAGLYRDLVERELQRGRAEAALTVVERAKARALVESLGWRFLRLADPADGELYREFIAALSRAERSRESSKVALFGARSRSLRYDALRKELAELKGKVAKRAATSPVLAALVDGNPSDAARIRSDLPKDRTLVEYYALEGRLVAFVVNGGVECVELTAPPRKLGRIIHSFVRGGAGDPKVARQLHDWLVAPLADKLKGRKLIIVPYGPLHQLPFETLVGPRGPLTRSYELSYLPAASLLKYLRWERPCAPETLRLLAVVDPSTDYDADGKPDLPPLPFARKEVESFEWRFPRREVFVGGEANEKRCVQRTPENSVIHYACHGEFYPSRPWDSPLFLSPGARERADDDGRLRAAEVYGLDLRRSCLVTLSGCETGANEIRPGDDPVSISTAFLHSGAGAMLVSLWKVEDEATATLMATFYKKWIGDGKSKAQSLRETKLEMAAGRFSHPRQWGAFVLIGEP